MEISQNVVTFSEYMNFINLWPKARVIYCLYLRPDFLFKSIPAHFAPFCRNVWQIYVADVFFLSNLLIKWKTKETFWKLLTCTDLKKKNPNLVFVCDPVMGDTGPGWYVPQTLLPIYRDEILPLADVCVPNQVKYCRN